MSAFKKRQIVTDDVGNYYEVLKPGELVVEIQSVATKEVFTALAVDLDVVEGLVPR